MKIQPPINIFSGAEGLGGALTNPTELARRKGNLSKMYPVSFGGRHWPDVETAYLTLAQGTSAADARDTLMQELIAAKFRQNPDLRIEVERCGGAEWLATCSHFTNARTEGFQKWEGSGLESRFIRNLVAGFNLVQRPPTELGQQTLF
jgi:hypothetical protein